MKQNKFGEIIFDESNLLDLLMQQPSRRLDKVIVDDSVHLDKLALIDNAPQLIKYNSDVEEYTVEQFDQACQSKWYMPDEYKNMDIAAYVLSLCSTEAQLQRCGEELLLYQEKNLFNLLKYLHYLVQVVSDNNIIIGVGRGSSVSSYVLYLLQVHKIDSLYYDLDPTEFLR